MLLQKKSVSFLNKAPIHCEIHFSKEWALPNVNQAGTVYQPLLNRVQATKNKK